MGKYSRRRLISASYQQATLISVTYEVQDKLWMITMETNSLSFNFPISCVYRNLSEFFWLRGKLKEHSQFVNISIPSLPPYALSFIYERYSLSKNTLQNSLYEFLNGVCQNPILLSSPFLHLFLQTRASRDQMQSSIEKGEIETLFLKSKRQNLSSLPTMKLSLSSTSSEISNDSILCDDEPYDSNHIKAPQSTITWNLDEAQIDAIANSNPLWSRVMEHERTSRH